MSRTLGAGSKCPCKHPVGAHLIGGCRSCDCKRSPKDFRPVHHDALPDEAILAEAMRIGDDVVEAIGSQNGRGTVVSALHEIAIWTRSKVQNIAEYPAASGAVHHDADALATIKRVLNEMEVFADGGDFAAERIAAALRSKNDGWACVEYLHQANGVHRKGFTMQGTTPGAILEHARSEVSELEDHPDDIDELADAMNCLTHYAITKGWSRDDVGRAQVRKMHARVTVPIPSSDGEGLGRG